MNYYPSYNDNEFNNILDKYEFRDQKQKQHIYQTPRQLLIRNFISKNTIYDNILLYWKMGHGKTCAAITIAEGFKEYISNMGRRIIVLVKNHNIETNFRNEMLSNCVNDNFYDDESKNKINRKINKHYTFITYGSFINKVLGRNITEIQEDNTKITSKISSSDKITNFNNTVIIIDEAHNITNNDMYFALEKVLKNSYNYRLVLLTGTPLYDNVKEIFELSSLLNLNSNNESPFIRNDLFKNNLVEKIQSNYLKNGILKGNLNKISSKGIEYLQSKLLGKISYLDIDSNPDTFPVKIDIGTPLLPITGTINVIYCEMEDYQYNTYLKALSLDSDIDLNEAFDKLNIIQDNIDIKGSSLYKNSSDASTMTYPNNLFGKDGFLQCFQLSKNNEYILKSKYNDILTTNLNKYSNKLFQLIENIKKSPGNIFIYSNYVNFGGTSLIKQLLIHNGYSEYSMYKSSSKPTFILYDDSTNMEERETLREIFNSSDNKDGKFIKILIGSPVISEGITLKNVNQVHILEPSWNMSRINQIIGRAIRHFSHKDIPNRNFVNVFKYCSIYSKSNNYSFIDKEKYILCEEKDRNNKEVERILKTISIDCAYNKTSNLNNYSSECDYTTCKYKCIINTNTNNKHDKFLYNLYIDFFEKFDIEYVMNKIRNLFKEFFIWNIDDIISNISNSENLITQETILYSLKQFIDNKISLNDKYDRSGFLINKGNFIIFNSDDINIDSTIFSKFLNFNINVNKLTLNDYITNLNNSNTQNNTQDNNTQDNNTQDNTQENTIPEDIIDYNFNIINNNDIYGSYRKKPIKSEIFGNIDNKFRIAITTASNLELQDKRKIVYGTVASSYTLLELKNIIEKFNIQIDTTKKYTQKMYIDIIKDYLIKNNLMLK